MVFSITGLILGLVFVIFGLAFISVVYKSYKKGRIHYGGRGHYWMVIRKKEQPFLFWFFTTLISILGIWLLVLALLFMI